MKPSKIYVLVAALLTTACGLQAGFPEAYKDKNPAPAVFPDGKKIFITQTEVQGKLNGYRGADDVCAADPLKPAGTFRALLVDGTNRIATPGSQADWVLDRLTNYIRTDGALIGKTNENGVFAFPLSNPMSASPAVVWTGLSASWSTTSDRCQDWTIDGGNGNAAQASAKDAASFFGSPVACNLMQRLICVQQ
jgi:hypothetical protein